MVLLAEFSELEKRYLETVRMLEESQRGEFSPEMTQEGETAFASEVRELNNTQQSTKNESGIFVEKTLRQQQSIDSTVETIALSTSILRLNNSLSEGTLFCFFLDFMSKLKSTVAFPCPS